MRSQKRLLYTMSSASLVWAGILIGVSFLATPAKFLAPSLTLAVALDVGRQTFGLFSKIEIFFALALVVAAMLGRQQRAIQVTTVLVAALVAVQVMWLLPVLDERVEIILHGGTPGESSLHTLYIVLESGKLLLLGVIAWTAHVAAVKISPERVQYVR